MKLLFCPSCHDVRKLRMKKTPCACERSWGKYTDDIHACYGGDAVPIGIDNRSLALAVKASYPRNVEAFTMPWGVTVQREQ